MLQWILTVLYILLILSVFTIILVDRGDSGRKFAWLLVIAVLPVVGLVLYLMFGINYRHHWIFNRRHQRYRDIFEAGTTPELNRILFGHDNESAIREEFRPLAKLLGAEGYPIRHIRQRCGDHHERTAEIRPAPRGHSRRPKIQSTLNISISATTRAARRSSVF